MRAMPSPYDLKMASGAKFDDTVFQQRAAALARNLGKDEFEFVKQQTGLLAREVARHTPPFAVFPSGGGTSLGTRADKVQGEWAVYIDVKWICTIKSAAEIAEAKKSWGTGPIIYGNGTVVARGIIDSVSQLRAWHSQNQGINNRTKPLKGPMRYWVPLLVLAEYVKQEQQKVGIAKAAFAKASLALGAKGTIPAWVKRHTTTASGSGQMIKESKGTKGTIIGRAGGLFHTNRHLPRLRKNRLIKAVKRGEYLMRQAAKDSGFNVV